MLLLLLVKASAFLAFTCCFSCVFPFMPGIEGSDANLSICSFVGSCSASTRLCHSL